MKEEVDILRLVADNPRISQRKISEQTGISLGQVNFLIKKCTKKGLLKIEKQTAKSIRYNITPKGLAEKAEKTAEYFRLSYTAVKKLTEAMKEIEADYLNKGKDIYVVGEDDELMQIARLALRQESFEYKEGANVVTINVLDFIE